MLIEYKGAERITGNLIFFKTVEGISYGEKVIVKAGEKTLNGKVIYIDQNLTLIELLGEAFSINMRQN
ncbi:MAG: hypothetical protein Q9M89_00575 [Persephonella sp.]|nr:hypothetical protein [Persephonella sp.]